MARSLLTRAIVAVRSLLRDHRAKLLLLAIASSGAGVYALTRSPAIRPRSATPRGDDVASASRVAQRSDVPQALSSAHPLERRGHPTPADEGSAANDRVAALRRGLASQDEATRIAAVEAAVSATAVETLGDLEKFELKRDPETAPTVIHAVALLGASADGAMRDDAATTLAGWLRDEMRRDGPDVPGNVSNIVEALGDVGGRNAVDALGAALDRADLALHVETLAVTKLGDLGDVRARRSVERFARRVTNLAPAEGIDEELRVEAIAAARTTLSRI